MNWCEFLKAVDWSIVVSLIALFVSFVSYRTSKKNARAIIELQRDSNRIAQDAVAESKKSLAQKRAEWRRSVGLYDSKK